MQRVALHSMAKLLLLTALCALLPFHATAAPGTGPLVVVGGGKADDTVLRRALELAGGKDAPIAILPQASSLPDTGEKAANLWRAFGATKITVASELAAEKTKTALREATLIWMPGGQQTKLMQALNEAGIPDILRERHRAGAVIGGTSAGAAVMSRLMITGESDLESITPQATKLAEGLSLWPEVIVDQHFMKRQRFNRLMSAVLDHPDKIGVGIDEGAAVIVSSKSLEVFGGKVLIIDARASAFGKPPATNAQLHLLSPGMTWKP
jgi:cyanophycinase